MILMRKPSRRWRRVGKQLLCREIQYHCHENGVGLIDRERERERTDKTQRQVSIHTYPQKSPMQISKCRRLL